MEKPLIGVLAFATALAGCLDALAPEPQSENPAVPAPASVPADGPAEPTATASSVGVFLAGDGTLGASPPSETQRVAYPEVVNSPFGETPAVWTGTLSAASRSSAEVPFVLFVDSNSAVFAARQLPVFEGLPGFWVTLRVGEAMFRGEFDGPDVIRAGEVVEVAGTLSAEGPANRTLEAGLPVELVIEAAYAHAKGAAELRFVLGADFPSGFTLGGIEEAPEPEGARPRGPAAKNYMAAAPRS